MPKNKKFQTLTIQGIITLANSRESIKFSIIKLYSKAITIQRTYNRDRV